MGMMAPPPPPPSSAESTPRRRSSVGLGRFSLPEGSTEVADLAKWTLFHDEDNQPYYLHADSGVSRWAYAADTAWMEVEDPSNVGCVYLEHSVTGDTKWKTATSTVWEEMKDPITQEHYFYSNVAKDSQWTKPLWIDYICQDTGCIYYFNTESNESSWSQPEAFTTEVEGGEPVVEPSAAAKIRLSLANGAASTPATNATPAAPMATPRDLPMATPRQVAQPPVPSMGGKSPAPNSATKRTVGETVAYSMHKRPKTAPPVKKESVAENLDVESASG
jgi:hypothetical protein